MATTQMNIFWTRLYLIMVTLLTAPPFFVLYLIVCVYFAVRDAIDSVIETYWRAFHKHW